MNKFNLACLSLITIISLNGCVSSQHQEIIDTAESKYGFLANKRYLDMFKTGYESCYDRNKMPYTSVVDAHNHFRPFGGNAIPMQEMETYLQQLGVLFVNVYGIGQTLPIDSGCEYYLDCQDTPVIPSIRNDFRNASNYLEFKPKGLHITLSMSFPDLAKPKEIVPQIKLLDREYPKQFKWMGEVNLVKQALFNNQVTPTPKNKIADWKAFMTLLRTRDIPIAIHSDLGNNENPTQYLTWMEEVLKQYPDNKIIWVHMGLSKELSNIDPVKHIKILSELLDQNPKLMLDLSWRVLWDYYFKFQSKRDLYVAFFNQYSTRILPGTDFVALDNKSFYTYAEEVEVNGRINKFLDDNAFRNIALGQNYFNLLNLKYTSNNKTLNYIAPQICK